MKKLVCMAICAGLFGCAGMRPKQTIVTKIVRVICPPEAPELPCPELTLATPTTLPNLSKDYNIVWNVYEKCFETVQLWQTGYDDCVESVKNESDDDK